MHYTPVLVDVLEFYNSLPDGQYACEKEDVNFTCVACLNGTLSWSSDDYIDVQERGTTFEFTSINTIGHRINSTFNPEEIYAVLTRVNQSGNTPCLQSTFHVRVSERELSENQSVVCSTTDNLRQEAVIQTLGNLIVHILR